MNSSSEKSGFDVMPGLGNRSLFFMHIPKTAGTSFRDLLRQHFLPDNVLSVDEEKIKLIDEVLPIVDRYRLVQGHLPYETINYFSKRPFVFTILRDPIDRAVSTFYFMKRRVSLPLKEETIGRMESMRLNDLKNAGTLTLLEFIRSDRQAAARQLGNVQVDFFSAPCSQYNHAPEPIVSERELDLAKERLSNCEAFGLVERLPETLEYLAYALQARPFDKLARINQTRSRPALEEIDSDTKAAVEELTRYDRQLYTFATELFEQRRSQMLRELLTRHAGQEFTRDDSIRELAPSFIAGASIPGEGWYAPEFDGTRWFNWTGPGTESWIELASPPEGKCTLQLGVFHAVRAESLVELKIYVNGALVMHEVHQDVFGHMVSAPIPASILRRNGRKNRIVLHISNPSRPCDSDPLNDDSRVLGIAFYHIALTVNS